MIPNAIEREILIEAPVETVWRVITEPAQIVHWFSDAAELDLRPGGAGTFTFTDKATSHHYAAVLRVETVEPPHDFAFRWEYPAGEEPRDGNSLQVRFTLVAEGEQTRLRVTESGFAGFGRPEDEKAAYYDSHLKGWEQHLGRLRDHVAARS